MIIVVITPSRTPSTLKKIEQLVHDLASSISPVLHMLRAYNNSVVVVSGFCGTFALGLLESPQASPHKGH